MRKLSRRLTTDIEDLLVKFAEKSPSVEAMVQRPLSRPPSRPSSRPSSRPTSAQVPPQSTPPRVPVRRKTPSPAPAQPAKRTASSRRSLNSILQKTPRTPTEPVWNRLHRNQPRSKIGLDPPTYNQRVYWQAQSETKPKRSASKAPKRSSSGGATPKSAQRPGSAPSKRVGTRSFTEDWERRRDQAAVSRGRLSRDKEERRGGRQQGKHYFPAGEEPPDVRLARLLSGESYPGGGEGEEGAAQAADVSGQDAKAIVMYLELMEHRMHHRVGHIDQEVNSMRETLQENFQELKRVMRMLATFLRDMSNTW